MEGLPGGAAVREAPGATDVHRGDDQFHADGGDPGAGLGGLRLGPAAERVRGAVAAFVRPVRRHPQRSAARWRAGGRGGG